MEVLGFHVILQQGENHSILILANWDTSLYLQVKPSHAEVEATQCIFVYN
jgi:hypothetical protein